MRATHLTIPILAIMCCVAAADKPDADTDAIKGTWRYVSTTEGGQSQAVPADVRLVITADLWKTVRPGQDPMGGKYTLDASKRPPHIDLMIEEDAGRPIVQKGIYELDCDTLRIRFAAAGKSRPADFKSKETSSGTTWVLQRVGRTRKE
jgi:uncharacterized protein (TIGR03067 family)